ncbi:MAG: hypothetical protein M3321_09540 [Actinomycetota bacterium]|nr:hypothetical protein [Actinomycetota bacterium]
MAEWWEQRYERGPMVRLPGFPRPLYPPDAAEHGKTPTSNGGDAIAYKRTVARLGRWPWEPDRWDDIYSNAFAHGQPGGNVGDSGIAGVQRQAGIEPASGWVEQKTFKLLRSVKIPEGLPHAGEPAMDNVARLLLTEAWETEQRLNQTPKLTNVRVTVRPGEPHWGGANDVMRQFVEPFMVQRGIPIGSGKRTPAENAAIGGSTSSDHLTTKSTTMARDFPTFAGEQAARELAGALGFPAWQENSFDAFTFSAAGRSWRAQILWGAQIQHADHIHVGIQLA